MVDLYHEMMGDPTTGYRVLGYFDDNAKEDFGIPIPYLGTVDAIPAYVEASGFHPMGRVYCCLPSVRGKEIRELIDYCENHLIRFYSVPNVRNYLRRPMCMRFVGEVPVLYIRKEPLRQPLNRFIKRMFDVVCSLLFLCTLFPFIYLIVGIITKATSPGPVFFKQKRNGLSGKEFYCYKFRSMYLDAEERKAALAAENRVSDGMMFKLDFDPRIIGSRRLPDGTIKKGLGNKIRDWSIDEFPQFWNVLKGDMSLVGTRPPTEDEWVKYELHHRSRLAIKPGITGMWQVSGRSEITDFEQVVALDRSYIANWSLELDVKILCKTVGVVLRHEGAM